MRLPKERRAALFLRPLKAVPDPGCTLEPPGELLKNTGAQASLTSREFYLISLVWDPAAKVLKAPQVILMDLAAEMASGQTV